MPAAPVRGWTARQDPFSSYRSGFEIRTWRLCHAVLVFHRFPVDLIATHLRRICTNEGITADDAALDELAASIAQRGVIQPMPKVWRLRSWIMPRTPARSAP